MKNLKTTFIVPPVLLLLLLIGVFAQQPKESSNPQRRLGIEISLSKSFSLPASNTGQKLAAFIRVPVKAGSETEETRISAIKLAPEMLGDKVKVTVSAISGDTSGIKTCSDWKALKESPIRSYTLSEGEEVTVSELDNLGTNFKGGMLVFKAVAVSFMPASPQTKAGGCECGWCGGLACCPNSGYCLTCGSC